ncbi:hypothetical protein C1646_756987 [Rhizophagus diaphanus]|nr:hypothetical protein C1646_756987 [Rhizophagus diaphanus] [Rhizophagus sp. MUCL 43196]
MQMRKKELPYYEDELLDYYNNEKEIVIGEEEELNINIILDLDVFVDTLGDIIEDRIDSIEEEIQDNRVLKVSPVSEFCTGGETLAKNLVSVSPETNTNNNA